jgi:hypothetical protein
MSSPINNILILLCVTTIINYNVPIPYIGFDFSTRHNFVNRLYLSLFSSFIIVLTDVLIHWNEFTSREFATLIIIFLVAISVIYYLIANQIFIGEKEYLLTMKENHEMDLHITNSVLKHKSISPDAITYGKKIISNRNDELTNIDNLLINKN